MFNIIFKKSLSSRLPSAAKLYDEFKKQYARRSVIRNNAPDLWSAYNRLYLGKVVNFYEFNINTATHYIINIPLNNDVTGKFYIIVEHGIARYEDLYHHGVRYAGACICDEGCILKYFTCGTIEATITADSFIEIYDGCISIGISIVRKETLDYITNSLIISYNKLQHDTSYKIVILDGIAFLSTLGLEEIVFDVPLSKIDLICIIDMVEHEIIHRR